MRHVDAAPDLRGQRGNTGAVELAVHHGFDRVTISVGGLRAEHLPGDQPVNIDIIADQAAQVGVTGQGRGYTQLDPGEVRGDERMAGVGGDAAADTTGAGHVLAVRTNAGHAPGAGTQGVHGGSRPAVAVARQLVVWLQECGEQGVVLPVVQHRCNQLPHFAGFVVQRCQYLSGGGGVTGVGQG